MEQKVLDVRKYSPAIRHEIIIQEFEKLKPGEGFLIVNDHEPIHLFHLLSHREDFDIDAYYTEKLDEGKWVAFLKKKGEETKKIMFTNFESNRRYSEMSFTPVQVYKTNNYAVILTYFKSGQFIPIHKPNIDVILYVHRGKGKIVAGEEKYEVKEGDLIIVPKGEKRGVLAETNMEILHIVSPPPSQEDHKEVEEGLKKGKFEE
jgi:quercetin dioxygenase-like cupin family protein